MDYTNASEMPKNPKIRIWFALNGHQTRELWPKYTFPVHTGVAPHLPFNSRVFWPWCRFYTWPLWPFSFGHTWAHPWVPFWLQNHPFWATTAPHDCGRLSLSSRIASTVTPMRFLPFHPCTWKPREHHMKWAHLWLKWWPWPIIHWNQSLQLTS